MAVLGVTPVFLPEFVFTLIMHIIVVGDVR